MPSVFGYVRVSTREQNEDRQLLAMQKHSVARNRIFIDKQSGKDFERPAYAMMLKRMRSGDTLVITSIDRLGRCYDEILWQWRYLTKEKKVDVVVLDMPLLDTRIAKDLIGTFVADLTLQILSFVAETERSNIHARQKEGIMAAKQRGVKFGRPLLKLSQEQFDLIEKWRMGLVSEAETLKYCQISRATLYRQAKQMGLMQKEAKISKGVPCEMPHGYTGY